MSTMLCKRRHKVAEPRGALTIALRIAQSDARWLWTSGLVRFDAARVTKHTPAWGTNNWNDGYSSCRSCAYS